MANSINIILPEGQLEGTSAALATWLVKVGDSVKKGDPLAELETDKVVMEVCADASGTVESLTAKVGDQVETNQVLGSITTGAVALQPQIETSHSRSNATEQVPAKEAQPISETITEDASQLISPAVRRLLRENEISIDAISGSGKGGRVTRDDVNAFLAKAKAGARSATRTSPLSTPEQKTQPVSKVRSEPPKEYAKGGELQGEMVPHTQMRKSIAKHMVDSLLNISPHVTSVFEMNMTNIMEHRKWHKKEYAEQGVKLTFTAYFLAAMAQAVKAVPQTNARFHEEALEIFNDVNIGVGTALGDSGLVVPVVKQVQNMSLQEIAIALQAQTEKARDGKLTPADMKNGTITISNHGVSGSLFASPIIINQPEVAILGIGKLEKRVVVESNNGSDNMVIKPMCYVSLSIDHRALDAHQTNRFLSVFVETIEKWGE